MTEPIPDFSIVTPSFNSLPHLKKACASLQDQSGATFEHTVVDAVSSDGTPQWLQNRNIRAIVEKDEGMYDAINKGMNSARGRFFAYLNCDEQYLPGTLARVKAVFDSSPDVDIVFGDCLIVRSDGELLALRRAYPLRKAYVAAWQLYIMTATMFYRRRVIDEGFRFDKRFRIAGDYAFTLQLLKSGYRAQQIDAPLAAFAITGKNLSGGNKSKTEQSLERELVPNWVRWLRYPINAARIVEKTLHGAYRKRTPLKYEIYGDDLSTRRSYQAEHVSHRWPSWTEAAAV